MRRVGFLWIFIFLWLLGGTGSVFAWPWGPDRIATINGQDFTSDDYKSWWINWKEKNTPFPDSAESFVDWHLLVQEAEKMELYNEPEYLHKVEVFLKARTLLLYRGDKISSRIAITDSELKDWYEKKYLPRLQLQILYFNDEQVADAALIKLGAEHDFEKFAAAAGADGKHSVYYEEKWSRINQLQQQWRPVVQSLAPGEMSEPFRWSKGFVIVGLKDQKGFDQEDYKALIPTIKNEIREMREQELTSALVEQLKKKYQVIINQPVFDALNMEAPDEKLLEQTLITMDNENYTVKVFLDLVNKDQEFRKQYGFDSQEGEKLKKRLLDGVLAQTLTTRGGLDEHYEQREPLRPLYLFYTQHRLIKELEKRLFRPKIQVSEEEIAQYYQANLGRFSQPEMVSIAVLEDEENLIGKMFAELKKGLDFFDVAARYYSGEVPVQNMQFNHLDPVVQSAINKLVIGEVSEPFSVKGHHTIIKLIKRTPANPMSLDHIRDKVADLVDKEKFAKLRNEYITALKQRSVIEINNSAWEKIKKELGDLHVGKEN
ncbi:MAG: peptidyl-prolyl cis-trans isomerase [Deltaproteobacteria bacterium]|nr:peptidyl-prolyl cis-trans isomerase [Deltaproteobacteria bacterium]